MKKTGGWALGSAVAGVAALTGFALLTPPSPMPAKAEPAPSPATTWSVFAKNSWPKRDAISAVTVTPDGDTWGSGFRIRGELARPAVQRWGDGRFRTVAVPYAWCGVFGNIDASSDKNVWAFGYDSGPYSARWNGKRWTRRGMLQPFSVTDAEALSPSDVGGLARHESAALGRLVLAEG